MTGDDAIREALASALPAAIPSCYPFTFDTPEDVAGRLTRSVRALINAAVAAERERIAQDHRIVYEGRFDGTCACGAVVSTYGKATTFARVLGEHIRTARGGAR